jgi:UDP-3-O-[3-hydroxymyristoyl] glucosamine N-acyltransferase
MIEVTLSDIVAQLGGEMAGDPALRLDRIGPPAEATPSTISFIASPRYRSQVAGTAAGCLIVPPDLRDAAVARGNGSAATIVTPDAYLYFARLTQWWAARGRPARVAGVHASAVVDAQAQVHAGASVGALAVVEAGARVGDGAEIGAHCHVGRNASIGAATRLAARVTVGEGCSIGERCIVHSGAVIGADGFGFAPAQGRWEKIEQLGSVRIGDDVEIGANTCIDRGALDDTVLEDGVKLDNLIQVGHNVRIGRHTAIAGCTGIAGSTTIGANCMIGGAVNILGHITICDRVTVSGTTFVSSSITEPGHYSGSFPFDENAVAQKNTATLRNLYELRNRVRALEKKNG